MKLRLVATSFCLGLLASYAFSQGLYGLSSDTPGTVYQVDPSTGAATVVVNVSGNILTSIVDIEFYNGTAYACDVLVNDGFAFGTIDLNAGTFTPLSLQDGSANWWGLAAKPSANILYTVDFDAGNIFKSITPLGVTTTIGPTGFNTYGMTYDSLNDVVYGTDGAGLYSINQATGLGTFIGNFGGPSNGMSDLAYDSVTDTLYANVVDNLYVVNRLTGAATLVGPNNLGAINLDGLGYTPVPEPATLTTLLLAVLAFRSRRKR